MKNTPRRLPKIKAKRTSSGTQKAKKVKKLKRNSGQKTNNKVGQLGKVAAVWPTRITESMTEGLVVLDAKGKVIHFNSSALKILGVTKDQLLGHKVQELGWKNIRLDGSDFPSEEFPSTIVRRSGKAVSTAEMGVRLPSGQIHWMRVSANRLRVPRESAETRSSKEFSILITITDITDLVEDYAQINQFFQFSLDLICIANTSGFFKRVSPSFGQVLGFSEEELIKRGFMYFIHPDDIASTSKVVQELSKGKNLVNFENRYRTHSGDYRVISWHCQPDTRTGDLFAIGRDVTDQRRAEVGFRRLIATLGEAAIVAFTDAKGVITEVNENFCRISGYSRQELVGQDHRIINSGTHSKEFFKELWKQIMSGRTWSGDIQNRRKNGEHYWVRSLICPIVEADQKILGFVAIRFDVTEEKRSELEMKTLHGQLSEAQQIAKIGSWTFDLKTYDLKWSTEHYRIFEIPEPRPPADLYRLYRERIHPEDIAQLDTLVSRSQKTGQGFVYDHRLKFDKGRVKYVRGIGQVIKDSSGQPIAVSGTCQDLTESVEGEFERKKLLNLFDTVLKNVPTMIFAKDFNNDLKFSLLNRAGEDLLGVNEAQIIGKSDYDFFPREQADFFIQKDKEVFESGKILKIPQEEISTSKGQRWLQTSKIPTYHESGKPNLLIGISTDITDEVVAKAELDKERSKNLQNSKLASLGEMSASIGHEINNPLSVIIGRTSDLLELIEDKKIENDDLLVGLEKIHSQALRINQIIRGLRLFSRNAENDPITEVSLKSVIEDTLALCRERFKKAEVELRVSGNDNVNLACRPTQISQVLMNLLNNAYDAVERGNHRWVEVFVGRMPSGGIQIAVTDSGKGIAAEIVDKVMQPFFTTKEPGKGTGLGLSISLGIVQDHGGTLYLDDQSTNTRFVINLPSKVAV